MNHTNYLSLLHILTTITLQQYAHLGYSLFFWQVLLEHQEPKIKDVKLKTKITHSICSNFITKRNLYLKTNDFSFKLISILILMITILHTRMYTTQYLINFYSQNYIRCCRKYKIIRYLSTEKSTKLSKQGGS